MSKRSSLSGLIIAIVMLLSLLLGLSGCGGQPAATGADSTSTAAVATTAPLPTSTPTTAPTVAAPATTATPASTTRSIVDHGGRSVTVPTKVTKIFSTSPVGTIAVYTLNPDLLIGWNYDLRPDESKYILPKYRSLPNLGGWYAKATANVEELLKIHPDVIISMGWIDDTAKSQADDIQTKLNIPVVLVDGDISSLDKAYLFLGDLLGVQTRAKELGDYAKAKVDDLAAKAKTIPDSQKVKVYYAEGAKGLQTDPEGSLHVQVLGLVGGINAAQFPDRKGTGGMGMTDVSLEQVLNWNPDLIISWGEAQGGFFKNILTNPDWQTIKAVQDKRVYAVPTGPYNWFDRPPSVNRIIGVEWLGNLLYPDVFKLDIAKEAKDFYKTFYQWDLTDQDVNDLLANSLAK